MESLQTTWTPHRTMSFLVAMVGDEASFYGRLSKHALLGGIGGARQASTHTLPSAFGVFEHHHLSREVWIILLNSIVRHFSLNSFLSSSLTAMV